MASCGGFIGSPQRDCGLWQSQVLAAAGACTVGPAYKPPAVEPAPPAFKEANDTSGRTWTPAQPQDDKDRGEWWKR